MVEKNKEGFTGPEFVNGVPVEGSPKKEQDEILRLVEKLKSDEPSEVQAAIAALEEIDEDTVIPRLFEIAAEDEENRWEALFAQIAVSRMRAVSYAKAVIDDRNKADIQPYAAIYLAMATQERSENLVKILVKNLDSKDKNIQIISSVYFLSWLGGILYPSSPSNNTAYKAYYENIEKIIPVLISNVDKQILFFGRDGQHGALSINSQMEVLLFSLLPSHEIFSRFFEENGEQQKQNGKSWAAQWKKYKENPEQACKEFIGVNLALIEKIKEKDETGYWEQAMFQRFSLRYWTGREFKNLKQAQEWWRKNEATFKAPKFE